ncbi:MAG: Ig-like domain-containing protein, partial [Bacteroidota bacterium]
MIRYLRSILISFLLIVGYKSFAQVKIFVNADVKHEVGGESTFDRSKWMVSHYSNTGINWIGEEDKLDYLINDLDTYFGRETGQITSEVMNRTPADMVARGAAYREEYAQLTTRHQYEAKQRLVIGNQDRIYSMMTGTEAGNRSAAFVNNYYGNGGTDGEPLPEFLELMNEPLFPLHDFPQPGEQQSISQIFQYHKNMATQLKANSPNTQIGGYVAAFSIFEENNFQRWNDRWKFYVDSVGYLMDFYSFHFYDFPGINNGVEQYRKGANNEATLDMFDHYTELVDMQRPWLISEYGSQVHDWYNEPWSSFRDWLFVKALNSMMIQFMERPDKIIFTVPFTVMKAEWGFGQNSNGLYPYQWRMMRRANEPESYSGDWVWTDYIKFYEFWEDVNGTRIDTKPADINLQVDAFVEEDKVYLIVNNLLTETKVFQPVIEGFDESDVVALSKRHLYLDGDVVALTDSTLSYSDGMSTTIAPEATVLLTYTLASPQIVDETSVETKYYASTYLQPISAETSITFEVNGVALDQQGEAVLRIGLGRDHGSSLSPDINLNGTPINAPAVYRGDDQLERPRFFGLLEIDVPYSLLATDNVIELSFPEDGGHVSSMAIQVFNTTRPIFRTPVTGVNLDLDSVTIASGKTRQLTANISPSDAFNQLVSWSSDDIAVATVDDNGLITAVSEGNTLVRVTTLEQDTSGDAYIDSVVVVVDDSFMLQVDSLAIAPSPLTVALGDTVQLTAEVFPVDADIKLVDWESQDPSIAVVDNDGRVVGISLGETTITATSPDGSNISDMVSVLVEDAAFVRFDDNDKYLNTIYRTGE